MPRPDPEAAWQLGYVWRFGKTRAEHPTTIRLTSHIAQGSNDYTHDSGDLIYIASSPADHEFTFATFAGRLFLQVGEYDGHSANPYHATSHGLYLTASPGGIQCFAQVHQLPDDTFQVDAGFTNSANPACCACVFNPAAHRSQTNCGVDITANNAQVHEIKPTLRDVIGTYVNFASGAWPPDPPMDGCGSCENDFDLEMS
ncbi:MAG: hypothetical protein ACREFF_07785 [Candidatus Udaeobacter sp.]